MQRPLECNMLTSHVAVPHRNILDITFLVGPSRDTVRQEGTKRIFLDSKMVQGSARESEGRFDISGLPICAINIK